MTALAGCWNYGGRPDPAESCKRMLAAQAIYGPHDEKQWSDGTLAMGRRLFRTLPEDIHDRQPLHGAGGRLTLVADVRLDNREDLAAALGLASERARGMCDAAMLLACLERWGEGALERLVGDFAFALWDAGEGKLLLARDLVGQRPLHFHRGDRFFAFASMPKGLHAVPEIPYAPDEQTMAEFITLIPAGGARSFFAGIELVEPGHVATVTREGVRTRRYWEPAPPDPRPVRGADYAEGLRHHLDLATRSRLRGSNGMVAAHLSAGYDSAAVAATAARVSAADGGKVVAFTAVPREGYEGPELKRQIGDEGPLAAATAALYPNIEHVLIRSGDQSPLENLDRYFYLYDRPALNLCNSVWTSAINAAARDRKITVLLTGQMGNMTISYAGLERLTELVGAGRLLTAWNEAKGIHARGMMTWRGVFAQAFGAFMPAQLWQWLNERAGRKLDVSHYTAINPDNLRTLDLERIARERNLDFSYRPRRNGFETRLWVLRRMDVGNHNKGILGGWGLDQRDPTADRRLIEYCLSVPMEEYLRHGEMRALGHRALSDRLPTAVLEETRKGYQAVDWHEGLTAARTEVEDELRRLAPCAPAARALDLDGMRALLAEWPQDGWERQETISRYRLALLRGLSAGHFLRKACGSNA